MFEDIMPIKQEKTLSESLNVETLNFDEWDWLMAWVAD